MSSPFKSIEPDTAEFRIPPGNFEAEMGLLGAMLINNRAYEHVSDYLRPEHFADPLHGRIYDACSTLIERGQRADPTTLKHFFDSDESFDEIGGAGYLAQLAADAVTIINAADYGKLIHDLYLRRELIELGTEVVNEAYGAHLDLGAGQQIESAEQKLYDLATTGDHEGGFITFTESMKAVIDTAQAAFKRGGYAGVPTGFTKLDLQLAGLHKSDLIILAARPSMGKTALATNIAFNIAASELDENGNVVPRPERSIGFFSLEMSSEQLANRILAEKAQIQSDQIRKGELNNRDFERLVHATQTLEKAPFFIDDTPALTVSALRTRARRLKRQHGLGLIVVDYLQLLQGSAIRRNENRVQEISEITRGLKTLAKELDVPVLALSQLSRAVEQREDKRPQLSDLRESGTIEQDADVVMFLFREEYYLERSEPGHREGEDAAKHGERLAQWEENKRMADGKAEVIIGKQRHGPTGTIPLRFYPSITKFDNLEDEDDIRHGSGSDTF
ncbi:MAG: replicative DNA helicase [Pseudomonadota bacterium]|nr:replicative DNA helicase [Pseudomonadota bacterium]